MPVTKVLQIGHCDPQSKKKRRDTLNKLTHAQHIIWVAKMADAFAAAVLSVTTQQSILNKYPLINPIMANHNC